MAIQSVEERVFFGKAKEGIMLVLARTEGEAVVIGDEIVVTVLMVDCDSITVRIDSPIEAKTATTKLHGTPSLAADLRPESWSHSMICDVPTRGFAD